MPQRMITVVLIVGTFFALTILGSGMSRWRMPDNHQGYAPSQPIDYSHRLHAGELGIDCRFCHTGASSGRYAGIPSSDVCMKCHRYVTAPFSVMQQERRDAEKENRQPQLVVSDELQKLYDSLALGKDLQPSEDAQPQSIEWLRVHQLPDYVYFNHQAHVTAGVACQKCHGPVESMERVRQHSSLSMGWCVNCHREVNRNGVQGQPVHASIDCTTCHR